MSSRFPTAGRLQFLVALAGLLAASSCGPSGPLDPKRPVVLLVTLDTTRADYLGCYGAEFPGISPRIDALAQEGVLFTQAISQAAVTPVSHASILTGLWPYNHELRAMHGQFHSPLDSGKVTLAEILKEQGYDTGAFVSALPVTAYFGFDQGFDHFDANFGSKQGLAAGVKDGMVNTGGLQRTAGDTTDAALAWMQQRDNPFFLWLHYFDVHDDHMKPPAEEFAGVVFSLDDRTRRRELYRLELTYMDRELGRVFDSLEAMKLWESAVVIVTSDHGEGLGDHDWWTHGVLYQEQVRVPLIVKAPGMNAGRRVDSTVRCLDIVPTVADLLKLAADDVPRVDGTSLVPLMNGSSADLGLMAYADSVNILTYNTAPPDIVDVKDDMLFSILLENRWKYIQHRRYRERSELYDLQVDPMELDNLYLTKPAIAKRAHEALEALGYKPKMPSKQANMPTELSTGLGKIGYAGGGSDKELESSEGETPK